jgi:hypothetical protein
MAQNGDLLRRTKETLSSRELLCSIKQQNKTSTDVSSNSTETTQQHADLLLRLKKFLHQPQSTDNILREFSIIPSNDVAVFRRLLKSVATLQGGQWVLK